MFRQRKKLDGAIWYVVLFWWWWAARIMSHREHAHTSRIGTMKRYNYWSSHKICRNSYRVASIYDVAEGPCLLAEIQASKYIIMRRMWNGAVMLIEPAKSCSLWHVAAWNRASFYLKSMHWWRAVRSVKHDIRLCSRHLTPVMRNSRRISSW